VRDAVIGFGNSFDARPDLAAFGNEIVIRIDYQQRSNALVVCWNVHDLPVAFADVAISRRSIPAGVRSGSRQRAVLDLALRLHTGVGGDHS